MISHSEFRGARANNSNNDFFTWAYSGANILFKPLCLCIGGSALTITQTYFEHPSMQHHKASHIAQAGT